MAAPAQLSASSPPTSTIPPSFGAPAATQEPSSSSRGKMANSLDLQDDSEMGPNSNYPPNHPAQYPQAAYSYSRAPANFAVDQDLGMVENYAHSLPQNMNQIDGGLQDGNGHAQDHGMSISTSNAPGMAPPQTPHQQSFSSPTGPRASIDGTADLANTGESSKRKRSKVSRACDECRRKKIRCDATDDDGSVKTCSNCTRSGQTCEYSRVPMKRGPSKGYIKELSERVQQVESQMAMSGGNQGPGYRQSLDGNMPLYPESSYSPDEPMSLNRNFSFSEARSNPFAQPQFMNRDRMPSTGGWSNASNPSGFRARDRGSVAVAPDQLPEAVMANGQPAVNYSKPFWAQEDGPPTKRQKVSTDDTENLTPLNEAEAMRLLKETNLVLPILGTPDATKGMMKEIPVKLQHAILFASSAALCKSQISGNTFAKYTTLESYVWDTARTAPTFRSTAENIAWMVIYLLMIVKADRDLTRFHPGDSTTLPSGTLLKLTIDLSRHLKSTITSATTDAETILIRNAFNLTSVSARLYAIGSGTEDPMPYSNSDNSALADLPASSAFLVRFSDILSIVATTIQGMPPSALSTMANFKLRKVIEQNLDFILSTTPNADPTTERLIRQARLYADILCARYFATQHPVEVLAPTIELVESLVSQHTAAAEVVFTPLTVHLFALTTITLLEFTDTIDAEMVTKANAGLASLRDVLAGITSDGEDSGDGHQALHWAPALLSMVDSKTKGTGAVPISNGSGNATIEEKEEEAENGETAVPAQNDAAAAASSTSLLAADTAGIHQVSPQLGGETIVDAKTGTVQLIDFRLLLRYGYMNVVAERNGL